MMDWEKLKTFECPHCGKPLTQEDMIVHCTVCLFEVHVDRYRSMLMHRSENGKPPYRNWWQNLHDDKCVQCGYFLVNAIGNYEILKCSNPECTFRINADRVKEILADPEHSANRFRKEH